MKAIKSRWVSVHELGDDDGDGGGWAAHGQPGQGTQGVCPVAATARTVDDGDC